MVAPDRYTILSGPEARQGTHYARVIVGPGDDPLNCCNTGNGRAEVSFMQDAYDRPIYENESSGIQQYGFSVKFDPTWQPLPIMAIFLQLHGPNGGNPAWAFNATDQIRFNMKVGDMDKNPPLKAYALSNGSLNIGKWIDFLLTVKYAKDNTGSVTLARRDEGQTSFTQVLNIQNTPTLQFSASVNGGAVGNHFMKHGLYRDDQPFTSILYLDGFTRTAVPSGS